MLPRTEKAILAISIEYPDIIPSLLANCSEDLFEDVYNQRIFGVVKNLYEGKSLVDWITVLDLVGDLPGHHHKEMRECLAALPQCLAERELEEKIKALKEDRGKRELQSEFESQMKASVFDADALQEILDRARLIKISREESNFKAAYKEYLDWQSTKPTNITVGLPSIDRVTDCFNYGEIVTIAARTTVGKTFFLLNIVNHLLSMTTDKIGIFSMEMSKATLIERLLQLHFNQDRWTLKEKCRTGQLDDKDFLGRYKNINVYSRVYSANETEKLIEKDNLKVIFIDFLQLMKKLGSGSLYEQTTETMRSLKEIAKNENIIIFLCTQITRAGQGGWEPVTFDMCRESGVIEEDADFIIGMWNPSLKEGANQKWGGKLCVKLVKNKRGPVIGIECHFDRDTGHIREAEKT